MIDFIFSTSSPTMMMMMMMKEKNSSSFFFWNPYNNKCVNDWQQEVGCGCYKYIHIILNIHDILIDLWVSRIIIISIYIYR